MDKMMSSLCKMKKCNIWIGILIRKLRSSIKFHWFTCESVVLIWTHHVVKYHVNGVEIKWDIKKLRTFNNRKQSVNLISYSQYNREKIDVKED